MKVEILLKYAIATELTNGWETSGFAESYKHAVSKGTGELEESSTAIWANSSLC